MLFCCDNVTISFSTDSNQFFWDDPRKVGVEVTDTDGSKYFRGPGAGTPVYLTHLRAKSRDFIKGGDAIFLLTMEGKSTRSHKRYCVQRHQITMPQKQAIHPVRHYMNHFISML